MVSIELKNSIKYIIISFEYYVRRFSTNSIFTHTIGEQILRFNSFFANINRFAKMIQIKKKWKTKTRKLIWYCYLVVMSRVDTDVDRTFVSDYV